MYTFSGKRARLCIRSFGFKAEGVVPRSEFNELPEIGEKVDATDYYGYWYGATILQYDRRNLLIYIKYSPFVIIMVTGNISF